MSPARWIPARAGILNVWRYYDEVFDFHRGRLLLRGRNGSGKSKALELLLPYLLDASLKPQRLSTFGNSDRTMWWNLMGQGVDTATRVGYVWLEFSRLGPAAADDPAPENQQEQWFTCGARLQASRSTNRVQADYFTTTARVGVPSGIELLNEARQPVSRAQLAELLSGFGEVHDTAEDYRSAVRRHLYPGMDPQRYDSLIQALLQLRRPKLSERLDPKVLSELLSNALPPLDAEEIAQLAEGFQRLDRQREHLAALDREVAAAGVLADRAKSYGRRVLRAGAVGLTQAHSAMEGCSRAARDSQQAHARAQEQLAELAAEQQAVLQRTAAAQEAVKALTDSQEYRAGRELDELAQQAQRAHRMQSQSQARLQMSDAVAAEARSAAADQQARTEAAAAALSQALPGAHVAAAAAGLAPLWERAVGLLASEQGGDGLLDMVRPAIHARLTQITQVATTLAASEAALTRRATAEDARDQAQGRAELADRAVGTAVGVLATALEDVGAELREWAAQADIPGIDPDELIEFAADDTRDPERPIADAVNLAAAPLHHDLAEQERAARNHLERVTEQRDATAEQLRATKAQQDLPPEASRFRTAERPATAGSPLWRLVRFRSEVPEADRAAVEAALEAAGLLDAWVADPAAPEQPGHDTALSAQGMAPVSGPTLAEVLEPEDAPGEPRAQLVAGILARIGLDPHLADGQGGASVARVGVQGRWRIGGLSGSWEKAASQHIGVTTRAQARQRRLDELAARMVELEVELTSAGVVLADVQERRDRLARVVARLPDLAGLRAARAGLALAQGQHADRLADLAAAQVELVSRTAQAASAAAELRSVATAAHLPQTRAALEDVRDRVEQFRDRVTALVLAARVHAERAGQLAAAQDRATSTAALSRSDAAQFEQSSRAAAAAQTRLDTLRAAVGASFHEVLERISAARNDLEQAQSRGAALQAEMRGLDKELGRAEDAMARDAARRDEAVAARDHAADALRLLLGSDLAADAGAQPVWRSTATARATLEAARAMNDLWASVTHEPRNVNDAAGRLTEAVHANRDLLATRALIGMVATDAGQMLEVTMNGVGVGATDLLAALGHERAEAATALTSEERELFDRTLTGDTRRHLADRLRRAKDLVDAMNVRLGGIRTASGIAVRITWQVDPEAPAQTKAARALFLKDAAMLSGEEREALHAFLRARIDQARAANTAGTWEQQLAQVFDYTAWHRFLVEIQHGDGQWTTLTPRRHGVLSGGEKAIALHLPLFAAVAAHYESVVGAPRFILLDEVFVGVDETNRGQVFRLLADLDLDLVATSDHEWCTYAELDGISIYQLISQGEDDPVTAAHFIWDGQRKSAVDPLTPGVLDFG